MAFYYVILKNNNYQTDDKYVAVYADSKKKEKFNGVVEFNVQVPAGTKEVWVAGTFGKEGDPLYWKHSDAKLKLKKIDDKWVEIDEKEPVLNVYEVLRGDE